MEYTLKFEMPYINCDNFKEKDLVNLLGVVTGTRIGESIKSYKYGNIRFETDDKQHWRPIVSELDSFARSKTNCIIFDTKDKDKYDKLFVYQSLNRENPYYGIVGLKTENGKIVHMYNKTVHTYFLELDYSVLVINMLRMIINKNKF